LNPNFRRVSPNAPEALKHAALSQNGLRAWCREQETEALRTAIGFLEQGADVERDVINEEIDRRQHRETQRHLKALQTPHWTVIPTFVLVIVAILVSLLAWIFPRH
jgi:hypothetical protein